MKEGIYGPIVPHVDSMEAEKRLVLLTQNTIALRKLPLLLHPFIFHPINSTVEKWAEFTQRETEMSVTDEKIFFLTHSGATGLSKEQRGQDSSPSVLQTHKALKDALPPRPLTFPVFFIFLTFLIYSFLSIKPFTSKNGFICR